MTIEERARRLVAHVQGAPYETAEEMVRLCVEELDATLQADRERILKALPKPLDRDGCKWSSGWDTCLEAVKQAIQGVEP
jgi:hypothetical protein